MLLSWEAMLTEDADLNLALIFLEQDLARLGKWLGKSQLDASTLSAWDPADWEALLIPCIQGQGIRWDLAAQVTSSTHCTSIFSMRNRSAMCVSICFHVYSSVPPAMGSPWNCRHIRLFSSSEIALCPFPITSLTSVLLPCRGGGDGRKQAEYPLLKSDSRRGRWPDQLIPG